MQWWGYLMRFLTLVRYCGGSERGNSQFHSFSGYSLTPASSRLPPYTRHCEGACDHGNLSVIIRDEIATLYFVSLAMTSVWSIWIPRIFRLRLLPEDAVERLCPRRMQVRAYNRRALNIYSTQGELYIR